MKHLIIIFTLLFTAITWGQIDRSKAPKPQPNPEVNIPRPAETALGNGLKIIIVENHNLPKVSFQLYIDNPPMMENEKVGLAEIFGDMLAGGTKSVPKDEFNEKIDFMGASFSTNSKGFYASSLTKHSDNLLSLLQGVIMEPLFDEAEFERIKTKYLSELEANKAEARSMSANTKNVVNYGENHPYGEVLTEKTLANITLQDVKNYYETYFRPNNAYLVIVGDLDPQKAKEIARQHFAEWKASPNKIEETSFSSPSNNGTQVSFVKKPGAVQSVISITHTLNLKPNSSDAIKLSVLNSILGGGSFSARLMSNLREDKAYTYGCYSSLNPDLLIGEFSAGGSFRNEVTDSAIVQILAEISRITDEEITDEELDLVIKSKTGAFARSLENPQTVARFALNTARYNLPEDYYNNYLKNLEAVTKADILEVAKKYLQPNNLNIIVVGNEDIAEKLTVFDSDGKIDLRNGFGEKATKLLPVPEGVTGESIIRNYLQTIYLTDNEKTIAQKNKKTKFILSSFDASIPSMGLAFDLKIANGSPNKTASVMTANGMTMQQDYFDGSSGKSISMQGETVLTESEIKAKSAANFPFEQVHYFADDAYEVTLLGIEKINDQMYYKVEIKNERAKSIAYEYYNTETKLLEKTEAYVEMPDGKTSEVTVSLSDYESYGKGKKAMLFSKNQMVNNNGMVIKMTLKSVTMAKKAPNDVFSGGLK
jgi:zinc protease